EKADEYEQMGHLLMANAHLSNENEDSITVQNLYDEGKTIEIPLLKDDADLAENAQHYYKKAQNSRNAFEEAERKIPKIQKEIESIQALYDEIEEIESLWEFRDWEKENKERI